MNHQENDLIEAKDQFQKAVQEIKQKNDKIGELELHKNRLTLYIADLQKRYRTKKEKQEEFKKQAKKEDADQ